MVCLRRTLLAVISLPLFLRAQVSDPDHIHLDNPREHEDDRLPNGKSQKDAIARENHNKALEDADTLVDTANHLRDQLKNASEFVVPISAVKRTEEVERLAKRIRSRIKG